MKIATRSLYGVRFLIELAAYETEEPVTIATIAARQGISPRSLEQVADILRRAGFVTAIKGASGGYKLSIPAQEMTLGTVLKVLEGDLSVVDPPSQEEYQNPLQQCLRLMVYDKLERVIASQVETVTIASLVGSVDTSPGYMYFI